MLTCLSEEHAALPAVQRCVRCGLWRVVWVGMDISQYLMFCLCPQHNRSPEGPRLRFRGSWKETYVRLVAAAAGSGDGDAEYERCVRCECGGADQEVCRFDGCTHPSSVTLPSSPTHTSPSLRHRPVRVRGLYSDVLHAPYAAAAFRGRGLKPAWLNRDNCPRLHRPTLEEFRRACEEPNMCVWCGLGGVWWGDWGGVR